MIDERKEEKQKQLAQTAVGLPKMKDDKHDSGMADGGGYMTLDKLDQNIFVQHLPKLTPKLGPPKMVDEAPGQKGIAEGAEYQTLGKLDMNSIFGTAKGSTKKEKNKKKSKDTNQTQDTAEQTDETEHTDASTVEVTKSEERSLAESKKKNISTKKNISKKLQKSKISSTHKKDKNDTKKEKKPHHHHKKGSSNEKTKSQPSLKEEIKKEESSMGDTAGYETLSSLDRAIFTQNSSATKSVGGEDDE
ncbi:unnamed protein product [Meloidogyne enterolobii]|uniref:Uncharacterized protein n=1 Tax=Meloidogyne enterolobii TaxID=390850 RepID=A0ACB1B4P8_MELEN